MSTLIKRAFLILMATLLILSLSSATFASAPEKDAEAVQEEFPEGVTVLYDELPDHFNEILDRQNNEQSAEVPSMVKVLYDYNKLPEHIKGFVDREGTAYSELLEIEGVTLTVFNLNSLESKTFYQEYQDKVNAWFEQMIAEKEEERKQKMAELETSLVPGNAVYELIKAGLLSSSVIDELLTAGIDVPSDLLSANIAENCGEDHGHNSIYTSLSENVQTASVTICQLVGCDMYYNDKPEEGIEPVGSKNFCRIVYKSWYAECTRVSCNNRFVYKAEGDILSSHYYGYPMQDKHGYWYMICDYCGHCVSEAPEEELAP